MDFKYIAIAVLQKPQEKLLISFVLIFISSPRNNKTLLILDHHRSARKLLVVPHQTQESTVSHFQRIAELCRRTFFIFLPSGFQRSLSIQTLRGTCLGDVRPQNGTTLKREREIQETLTRLTLNQGETCYFRLFLQLKTAQRQAQKSFMQRAKHPSRLT